MRKHFFVGALAAAALLVSAPLASAVHIPPGQVFPPTTNGVVQAVNDLFHDLGAGGQPNVQPKNELRRLLAGTIVKVNQGDFAGACNDVNAFIRLVEGATGNTIDVDEATRLIAKATGLKQLINELSPGSCPP